MVFASSGLSVAAQHDGPQTVITDPAGDVYFGGEPAPAVFSDAYDIREVAIDENASHVSIQIRVESLEYKNLSQATGELGYFVHFETPYQPVVTCERTTGWEGVSHVKAQYRGFVWRAFFEEQHDDECRAGDFHWLPEPTVHEEQGRIVVTVDKALLGSPVRGDSLTGLYVSGQMALLPAGPTWRDQAPDRETVSYEFREPSAQPSADENLSEPAANGEARALEGNVTDDHAQPTPGPMPLVVVVAAAAAAVATARGRRRLP